MLKNVSFARSQCVCEKFVVRFCSAQKLVHNLVSLFGAGKSKFPQTVQCTFLAGAVFDGENFLKNVPGSILHLLAIRRIFKITERTYVPKHVAA